MSVVRYEAVDQIRKDTKKESVLYVPAGEAVCWADTVVVRADRHCSCGLLREEIQFIAERFLAGFDASERS